MGPVSALLLTAALIAAVSVFVPVGTAAAQGSPADGEPTGFVAGEGSATAGTVVLGLSPGGGKPIDISLGVSRARYQNRTATSEGAALGLGLLQIFLGEAARCSDRPPIIPNEQLPPVTTNDSRRNRTITEPVPVRSPGDVNGPGGVLGTQIANAGSAPQWSGAATTTVSQDFGVVALDGGRSEATTRLVGGVREAVAVTTGTQLRILGGLVVINQPRWEAIARTGAVTTTQATFTFSSASIFGIDRPADQFVGDLSGFADGLANLLSGLGVHLDAPRVIVEPAVAGGNLADGARVEITPLVFRLANPPIGLDLIRPLLTALAPLKAENTARMIAEDCNNQAVLQIVDLVLGVLSGSGAVSLSIGGASASTAATEFPEPAPLELSADGLGAPPAVVAGQQLIAPVVAPPPTFARPTAVEIPPVAVPVAALPEAPVALPQVAAPVAAPAAAPVGGPAFELPTPDLVVRRFEPGKPAGRAVLVGSLALAGLLVLAAMDRALMVRRRREGTR